MPKMYELLHCPFCGSTDISDRKEDFNFRAAFWACLFIHISGVLFGCFCRNIYYVRIVLLKPREITRTARIELG